MRNGKSNYMKHVLLAYLEDMEEGSHFTISKIGGCLTIGNKVIDPSDAAYYIGELGQYAEEVRAKRDQSLYNINPEQYRTWKGTKVSASQSLTKEIWERSMKKIADQYTYDQGYTGATKLEVDLETDKLSRTAISMTDMGYGISTTSSNNIVFMGMDCAHSGMITNISASTVSASNTLYKIGDEVVIRGTSNFSGKTGKVIHIYAGDLYRVEFDDGKKYDAWDTELTNLPTAPQNIIKAIVPQFQEDIKFEIGMKVICNDAVNKNFIGEIIGSDKTQDIYTVVSSRSGTAVFYSSEMKPYPDSPKVAIREYVTQAEMARAYPVCYHPNKRPSFVMVGGRKETFSYCPDCKKEC